MLVVMWQLFHSSNFLESSNIQQRLLAIYFNITSEHVLLAINMNITNEHVILAINLNITNEHVL
jgi:hypothetical protein